MPTANPVDIVNTELWRQCHKGSIDLRIRRSKRDWVGQTLRKVSNHIPKQDLEWYQPAQTGPSKENRRRSTIAEAKSMGLT